MKTFIQSFFIGILLISFEFQLHAQCNAPIVHDVSNTCASPNQLPLTLRATNQMTCGLTISHKWYTSPTGSTFITGTFESASTCAVYTTKVDVNAQTTYWVSAVINGCESPRSKITAFIYRNDTPVLKLSPSLTHDANGFYGTVVCTSNGSGNVSLTASGGSVGSVYEWYSSPISGTVLSTNASYNTTINESETMNGLEFFYVGGTLKNDLGCSFPINPRKAISVKLMDYQTWTNHVTSFTPLTEFTSANDVMTSPVSSVMNQTQYLDGLGRPVQTVFKQGSPGLKDIVQPIVYDAFGRESRKYLPVVPQTETSGLYKPNIIDASGNYTGVALNFYNNPSDNIADDSKPFAETVYESPLNRIKKIGSAGTAWQPNPMASTYPNYTQDIYYTEFVASSVGGGGGVNIKIQDNVLTVTFSAGFSSTQLKTGYIKTIYSNPIINDMELGLISMGHYKASIKNGSIFIEAMDATPANVTGFSAIFNMADHSVKKVYGLNKSGEIIDWSYDAATGLVEAGTASTPVYYQPNRLFVVKTLDEHNNLVIEYSDNEGKTLLKRVQTGTAQTPVDDTNFASTYYIYDDLNNLVCVLPPEAVNRLSSEYYHSGATNASKISFLNRWAFRYSYDKRKRMASKQVPGAKPVYLIYDQRNRVILTQAGNQRKSITGTLLKDWLYTKYDAYNRPVITGLYTHPANDTSQVEMQAFVNSQIVTGDQFYEDYNGVQATDGYTNRSFPTANKTTLTATYYDNYGFVTPLVNGGDYYITTYSYQTGDLPGQELQRSSSVKGAITGSKVNVLGTSTYLWTVTYYDTKYRTIQTITQNLKGGADRTTNRFDFASRLMDTKRIYTINGTQTTVKESFTYDHGGRLLSTKHSVNGGSDVVVAANYYNEIGQLVKKGQHTHTTSYPPVDSQIGQPGVTHSANIERGSYNPAETTLIATNSIRLTGSPGFHVPSGSVFSARIGFTEQEAADAVLSQFAQVIDYRYNIRGWLTRINNADVGALADGNTGYDYFGVELAYNNSISGSGLTTEQTYNGNISALRWSKGAGGPVATQAYTLKYDPMSRLKFADHFDYKISTASWVSNNNGYSESLTYDMNGNIQTLLRKGFKGASMDNLVYQYTGNQLNYVNDSHSASEGFVNLNTGTDDYSYDYNGNLDKDKNKGVLARNDIKYNHLNLPKEVVKGIESLKYIYDASGRKLAQEVYTNNGSTLVKRTDYIGEMVFEGTSTPVLQFIQHSEGRIVPDGSAWEYQYHMKDHLGNIRVSFTTRPQAAKSFTAHMENTEHGSGAQDFGSFNSFVNNPMDHTDAGTVYERIHELNGGYNGRVGMTKSFVVMPGDQINASVYARYSDLTGSSNPNTLIASLATAFNVSSSSVGEQLKLFNGLSSFAAIVPSGDHLNDDDTAPKAFITILFFDNNYNFLDAAWDQVSTAGQNSHDLLSVSAKAPEAGFAYIFLSNEHPGYVRVYFDDLTLTHAPSQIVSASDYYPFGLTFNSYNRENSAKNRYLYNGGAERQDALDLNVDATKYRTYDPAIGRWWQMDPMADLPEQIAQSPYQYGWNNPVRYNDPNGDCPCIAIPFIVYALEAAIAGTATYIAYDAYDRSKFKAETLQIHNEGSFLNNDNHSPDEPNFNFGKRALLVATAVGLATELLRENAKYLGLDPKQLDNVIKNMNESELQFFINNAKGMLQSESDRITDRQFFGLINPSLLISAYTYDIKKDVYSLRRGLTPEQQAAENEEKKKGKQAKELLNNFSNVEEGTYIWNGSNWVLE